MAKHEVSIVVKAYDAATRVLRGVQASVSHVAKKITGAATFGIKWGGAALTAGMALSIHRAHTLNKAIAQSQTIADISFNAARKQVMRLSAEFGVAKDALSKGLYDALSAGVPKDNVFEFLETAARAGVAGAGTTAEAVDILTSAINAFNIPARKAGQVSDVLFETVRLGKTTLSELAAGFAAVGPIAANSGVALEQVMAAVATLTASGTKSAEAFTQIRAAIVSMNDSLGDGWSKTMTFQDAVTAMRDRAGGSIATLKEMVGRIEGVNAILGLTGGNAQKAAAHLSDVATAAGATERAMRKVKPHIGLDRVIQSLDNIAQAAGNVVMSGLETVFPKIAKAISDGADAIDRWGQSKGIDMVRTAAETALTALKALSGFDGEQKAQATWAALGNLLVQSFETGAAIAGNIIVNALVTGGRKLVELHLSKGKMLEFMNPLKGGAIGMTARTLGKLSVTAEDAPTWIEVFDATQQKKELAVLMDAFKRLLRPAVAEATHEGIKDGTRGNIDLSPDKAPSTPSSDFDVAATEAAATEAVKTRNEEYLQLRKREEDITAEMEKQAKIDTLQGRMDAIDETIRKLEQARDAALAQVQGPVFGTGFDDWRKARDDDAAQNKRENEDFARLQKLREKQDKRGIKLSREDEQWLKDMEAAIADRAANEKAAKAAQDKIDAAQKARDELQAQIKASNDKQAENLTIIREKITKLLEAPIVG